MKRVCILREILTSKKNKEETEKRLKYIRKETGFKKSSALF